MVSDPPDSLKVSVLHYNDDGDPAEELGVAEVPTFGLFKATESEAVAWHVLRQHGQPPQGKIHVRARGRALKPLVHLFS